MAETPKIIVDSDWKSQARAEKERLSATERPAPAAGKPPAPGAPPTPAPAATSPQAEPRTGAPEQIEASFEELLRLLATQALMYLGAFPDPETGRAIVALDYAKLHIDMMGVLEQKTKGNLSEHETSLLQRTLYELRMQYAEIAKAVAKAVEEGRISKSGGVVQTAPRPAAS